MYYPLMSGLHRDGDPPTDARTNVAERLRHFGIDFDRSVRKGVEQLRNFTTRTSGKVSVPDLGFDFVYQAPDRDHLIETLTVNHSNNLRGLVLSTTFFTMEHPDGVFGITRTQALKKGDKVLTEMEPRRLSPEAAERVAMIADNPVMKASLIELMVEPQQILTK